MKPYRDRARERRGVWGWGEGVGHGHKIAQICFLFETSIIVKISCCVLGACKIGARVCACVYMGAIKALCIYIHILLHR